MAIHTIDSFKRLAGKNRKLSYAISLVLEYSGSASNNGWSPVLFHIRVRVRE
jgi:hypothetical protein